MILLMLSAVRANVFGGFTFPRHFLLFLLLADVYSGCLLLWLLRRMKKQQQQGAK
jgi:phage-related holin